MSRLEAARTGIELTDESVALGGLNVPHKARDQYQRYGE